MQCEEARELLSVYYDGELTGARCEAVEHHVQRCRRCSDELRSFLAISNLAANLQIPDVPDAWDTIERELPNRPTLAPSTRVKSAPSRRRRWILTAAIAFAAGVGVVALLKPWGARQDDHLAVNFGRYLDQFAFDPHQAQQSLLRNYDGRKVTIDQAADQLKYTPVAAGGLPGDYTLSDAYLLKMPCCLCLEAVFRRPSGGSLAVFEHDEDQPVWFGDRPAVQAGCDGKQISLIQIDGTLAASWKGPKRHLTVVGATNVEEIVELVRGLGAPHAHRLN